MTIRLRRAAVLFFAIVALLVIAASPTAAHAAAVDPATDLVVPADAVPAIVFAPSWVQLLTLVVTVVLPLLVGLVTKVETNASTKAILLAVLAVVTGFGSELLAAIQAGQTYDAGAGLFTAVTALVIAVALHFGIYKPTGAARAAQEVGGPGRHEAV